MTRAVTTRKSTKVSIPHSDLPGVNLVGILEQVQPDAPTQGRDIALVRLFPLSVRAVPFSGLKLFSRGRFCTVPWGEFDHVVLFVLATNDEKQA